MLKLTKASEKTLWSWRAGNGVLYLKTGPRECLAVEVYVSWKTGELKRMADGQPVLPIAIDRTEED